MSLSANAQGIITGRFTVPPNVPTGTKRVQCIGSKGSYGEASYTGRGTITTEERRRVTTITELRQEQTTITLQRHDPLAQTFTLPTSRHIGGVDLWFSVAGTSKTVIQIRETSVGLPTQQVLAEAHLSPDAIITHGSSTRITWQPVYLEAGVEYALVILTDDPDTTVRIAELGKYDALHQNWVTSQPFQVGVLLSSSNASTWTPHQDKDLTFRLLGCRFTEEDMTIPLGDVQVSGVSDVMILANVERPATLTECAFTLTNKDGDTLQISDNEPLNLRKRIEETLTIAATLKGSALYSPVLFPSMQLLLGNMNEQAHYISRAIEVGMSEKITLTYAVLLTGQARLNVEVEDNQHTWQTIPLISGKAIGDGWEERTHVLEGFNVDTTRIKLSLSGNATDRPRVRSLRAVIT